MQRRLSGRPPIIVDGQRLEADVQLMLAMSAMIGEPVWDERLQPEAARTVVRETAATAAGRKIVPVGAVEDLTVAGLPARRYVSAEPGEKPALLYLHGGGFVVGDLETHDPPCRVLCRHAGVDVLSVEYRKAPEHPFPGYVDDARRAYEWAAERYDRVVVGGDSAGGNLAATLALEYDPELALLIYPVTDMTTIRESHRLFGKGFFLTDEFRDWYAGHFLGDGDPADPLRSPLLSPNLKDSAPVLLILAGFDPLRDEGRAYGRALEDAGVPVTTRLFPGLIHSFIHAIGASPSSRAALIETAGMLRALLQRAA
ncbi:alpha/beta hydrolase [Solirubrobacter taibaiensis]|nr:alpha/beta hydrolase [Solirubrobacter taibaiensis]